LNKVKQVLVLLVLIFNFELKAESMEKATFGAGCFWCVEAIFEQINGVTSVKSGYMGGDDSKANYRDVCAGNSGHAEVIQIEFDTNQISFKQLLEVLFSVHDPTTLNRQGNDVGSQYRSAIFYHNNTQKEDALSIIDQLNKAKIWSRSIVTEVVEAKRFYDAEAYHQDYYSSNTDQPYCNIVITPKLEKFKKVFSNLVK